MGRAVRLLQVLGVNSVPALGVFAADWTATTALALYWCENVLVSLMMGSRIWLHRRATGKRGHWEAHSASHLAKGVRGGTFLGGFLTVALVFTAAHGVFLSVILFLVIPREFPDVGGVEREPLLQGLAAVSIFLVIGLLYDAIGIGSRTFAWVRALSERVLGRVVLVHLTIIFGMGAMFWFDGPLGLFLIFATLKTLSDLSAMVAGDYQPSAEPPGCLMAPIRALGGVAKAEDFARFHRDEHEKERRRAAEWEERRPGGS